MKKGILAVVVGAIISLLPWLIRLAGILIYRATDSPIFYRFGYTGYWETIIIQAIFYLLGGLAIALIASSHKVAWTFLTGLIVSTIPYFLLLILGLGFEGYVINVAYCLVAEFIGLGLGIALFKKR